MIISVSHVMVLIKDDHIRIFYSNQCLINILIEICINTFKY